MVDSAFLKMASGQSRLASLQRLLGRLSKLPLVSYFVCIILSQEYSI